MTDDPTPTIDDVEAALERDLARAAAHALDTVDAVLEEEIRHARAIADNERTVDREAARGTVAGLERARDVVRRNRPTVPHENRPTDLLDGDIPRPDPDVPGMAACGVCRVWTPVELLVDRLVGPTGIPTMVPTCPKHPQHPDYVDAEIVDEEVNEA